MEQAASLAEFQSTLPMKGATILEGVACHYGEFQSTLPMKGATAKSGKKIKCPPDMGISLNVYL